MSHRMKAPGSGLTGISLLLASVTKCGAAANGRVERACRWERESGKPGKAGSQAERQSGRKPEHLHALKRTVVRGCAQPLLLFGFSPAALIVEVLQKVAEEYYWPRRHLI